MPASRSGDRVVENLADRSGAVAGEQFHPGPERPRNAGGEQTRAGDDVQPQIADRGDARRLRSGPLPAHHERLPLPGVEGDNRDLTAQTVQMRLDDLQHEPGGRRRVERVAASLEGRHPRGGGQPVGRGDHPEVAHELLAIGEPHAHDPEVKVQFSGARLNVGAWGTTPVRPWVTSVSW